MTTSSCARNGCQPPVVRCSAPARRSTTPADLSRRYGKRRRHRGFPTGRATCGERSRSWIMDPTPSSSKSGSGFRLVPTLRFVATSSHASADSCRRSVDRRVASFSARNSLNCSGAFAPPVRADCMSLQCASATMCRPAVSRARTSGGGGSGRGCAVPASTPRIRSPRWESICITSRICSACRDSCIETPCATRVSGSRRRCPATRADVRYTKCRWRTSSAMCRITVAVPRDARGEASPRHRCRNVETTA